MRVTTAFKHPLRCATHGIRTEAVPFARAGSGFTADFEALAAWPATKMNKTAVTRLLRIAWITVGAICERVSAAELDPRRLSLRNRSCRLRHSISLFVAQKEDKPQAWQCHHADYVLGRIRTHGLDPDYRQGVHERMPTYRRRGCSSAQSAHAALKLAATLAQEVKVESTPTSTTARDDVAGSLVSLRRAGRAIPQACPLSSRR